MIVAFVDRALREFEIRTASPATVRRAVRLAEKFLGRGNDAAILRNIQTRRLRSKIQYVYQRSPFYQDLFERAGVHPDEIKTVGDLQELPFTNASDILDFRRFLCVPEDELSAVFTTSGTTGEPKRVYYTYAEMHAMTNFQAAALLISHPGKLHVLIALPLSHGLWMGSATAQRVVERAGGLPIPVGADDPIETLRWMRRFEPNVVMSSPSYMTALTREAERAGYRPMIEKVLLGGEKLTDEHKARFREYWGAEIFDSYGSTEIGGPQTIALPECTAFNLNDLYLVTEIVNPETGKPADEGELVFTTLTREAMPFLRYRSGDRGCWANCPCGMPLQAIQLLGRIDDMLVAGDMNLYGNVIAEAISRVAGTSGRILLRLDKVDLTDRLAVCVEGRGVNPENVKTALFQAYPELRVNAANGNLILEIDAGVELSGQIKALKIADKRNMKRE